MTIIPPKQERVNELLLVASDLSCFGIHPIDKIVEEAVKHGHEEICLLEHSGQGLEEFFECAKKHGLFPSVLWFDHKAGYRYCNASSKWNSMSEQPVMFKSKVNVVPAIFIDEEETSAFGIYKGTTIRNAKRYVFPKGEHANSWSFPPFPDPFEWFDTFTSRKGLHLVHRPCGEIEVQWDSPDDREWAVDNLRSLGFNTLTSMVPVSFEQAMGYTMQEADLWLEPGDIRQSFEMRNAVRMHLDNRLKTAFLTSSKWEGKRIKQEVDHTRWVYPSPYRTHSLKLNEFPTKESVIFYLPDNKSPTTV